MTERLISFCGLLVMLLLAWAMSSHRRLVPWRVVAGGLALQICFALLILKTATGAWFFNLIGDAFQAVIGHVNAGSSFLFQYVRPDTGPPPDQSLLGSFAFGVLPTIVFFSSLMSILYYLGVMQKLVELIAWVMQRTLKTSGAESL
ncbi:MAG: hypothetical protein KDA92_18090, partial [Planctomycetales bacterium]|nr:hypothetical protein [Planctomycetales bacterium]